MRYMLDTCTVIFALKQRQSVLDNILSRNSKDLCISSITYAELTNGIHKSKRQGDNLLALLLFLAEIEILPFDSSAAEGYGDIYSVLTKEGSQIGKMDALIAGHAKTLGYTLVSNNLKEFVRVEGLLVEDWTA